MAVKSPILALRFFQTQNKKSCYFKIEKALNGAAHAFTGAIEVQIQRRTLFLLWVANIVMPAAKTAAKKIQKCPQIKRNVRT